MHAAPTVDLAHHELCKAFSDLKISVNAVYKYMISKCKPLFKKSRNSS